MKPKRATVLFLMSIAAVVCAWQEIVAEARAFHWNAKDSQELGREDRISQLHSLTSSDRQAIIDALVPLISSDEGSDANAQEVREQAADTRVKLVDLNGDGIPEVIAQASGDELCSPTGNCSFWVLMRSGREYRLILDGHEAQTFTIQHSRSNGFLDLVLGMHGAATEEGLFVYHYIQGHYQSAACYNADWVRMVREERKELKNPDVTPCSQ